MLLPDQKPHERGVRATSDRAVRRRTGPWRWTEHSAGRGDCREKSDDCDPQRAEARRSVREPSRRTPIREVPSVDDDRDRDSMCRADHEGGGGAPAPVPANLVGPEKCPRDVRAGLQQPERAARRGVAPPTAGRRAGRERGPQRRELMSSDATSRRAAARPTCLARGADGGNCCRGITIEGRCETA